MRFATVLITVLLVWALPSAVAQAGAPDSNPSAGISAVKKPGLKKALKKCRTIRKADRRKACVKRARKKFTNTPPVEPVEPKPGKTWRVDVLDHETDDYLGADPTDFFSPEYLEVKVHDRIEWVWSDMNQNPHNVTFMSGPAGINRFDYMTPNSPSGSYRWSRQLDKTGTWVFACSLHHLMRLAVKVGK
jgi:plastocyanin